MTTRATPGWRNSSLWDRNLCIEFMLVANFSVQWNYCLHLHWARTVHFSEGQPILITLLQLIFGQSWPTAKGGSTISARSTSPGASPEGSCVPRGGVGTKIGLSAWPAFFAKNFRASCTTLNNAFPFLFDVLDRQRAIGSHCFGLTVCDGCNAVFGKCFASWNLANRSLIANSSAGTLLHTLLRSGWDLGKDPCCWPHTHSNVYIYRKENTIPNPTNEIS
jgi:hypothetical protein